MNGERTLVGGPFVSVVEQKSNQVVKLFRCRRVDGSRPSSAASMNENIVTLSSALVEKGMLQVKIYNSLYITNKGRIGYLPRSPSLPDQRQQYRQRFSPRPSIRQRRQLHRGIAQSQRNIRRKRRLGFGTSPNGSYREAHLSNARIPHVCGLLRQVEIDGHLSGGRTRQEARLVAGENS
jgi:hypothetical protein